MQMQRPKKKKLTFWLIGLLIAAALGAVLWIFQDTWLPYWLPAEEEPGPAIEATATGPVAAQASESAAAAPAPPPEVPLDFLSAATWDHPQFHQGVRLFNQALDRYRQYLSGPQNPELLAQVAEGTRQAGRTFQSLKPVEPSDVPLDHALDQCRKLMAAVQESRTALLAAKSSTPKQPAVPRIKASKLAQHPDYLKGAKQFNQALDQFNQYKANTTRKELLKPTEDMAREAAQTFEALKRQAATETYDEIDRYIHKCYGIVSACRQQQLEASGLNTSKAKSFDRGTTGPSRRPPLPAYQPPQ